MSAFSRMPLFWRNSFSDRKKSPCWDRRLGLWMESSSSRRSRSLIAIRIFSLAWRSFSSSSDRFSLLTLGSVEKSLKSMVCCSLLSLLTSDSVEALPCLGVRYCDWCSSLEVDIEALPEDAACCDWLSLLVSSLAELVCPGIVCCNWFVCLTSSPIEVMSSFDLGCCELISLLILSSGIFSSNSGVLCWCLFKTLTSANVEHCAPDVFCCGWSLSPSSNSLSKISRYVIWEGSGTFPVLRSNSVERKLTLASSNSFTTSPVSVPSLSTLVLRAKMSFRLVIIFSDMRIA